MDLSDVPGGDGMTKAVTSIAPGPVQLTRWDAVKTVEAAATLLFANGQTTDRTVVAAERLGRALGVPLTLHPRWGELEVRFDGTLHSAIVAAAPLGVDMAKVPATMKIVDQVCDGTLPGVAARSALAAVGHMAPVSTLRFALFAAIGAASMGVIYGVLDAASLLLMAFSGGLGAALRRWLATLGGNPFIQPLCAAAVAGAIGAVATHVRLPNTQLFVALCPCMLLVPGPHILNAAFDLVHTRIALGIARLTYAGLIVLMICAGLLLGLAAGGATVPAAATPVPVPFLADVVMAGCAVAAYGTFFSMRWRFLGLPVVVGMLAHAAHWALISLAGADVAVGALVACTLVGIVVTPIADRLHLPFAALAFCAVVPMMPGFFLFRLASARIELVASREPVPADLVASMVANGTTAFLIILAMSSGLIVPRMLYDYLRTLSPQHRSGHA
jgi:uncharacterized membrane protein YjjP (DUF1212 family)